MKNTGSDWTSGASQAWHMQTTLLTATSQKALEHLILDLTEGFSDRPSKNKTGAQHKFQDPRLQAGDARVAWKPLIYVWICMMLNGNSAPSVQHRTKQAQGTFRNWHKVLRCPYSALVQRMWALAKAVSMMRGAPACHPTEAWQEKLTSWGARIVADTSRMVERNTPTMDT